MMDVKANRRGFLGFLSAAPLLAKSTVAEVVANKTAALNQVGMSVMTAGVAPSSPGSNTTGAQKMLALQKLGLLPDGVFEALADNMDYDRMIKTDLACLRSVSPSGMVAIHANRRARALEAIVERSIVKEAAWQTMRKYLYGDDSI